MINIYCNNPSEPTLVVSSYNHKVSLYLDEDIKVIEMQSKKSFFGRLRPFTFHIRRDTLNVQQLKKYTLHY